MKRILKSTLVVAIVTAVVACGNTVGPSAASSTSGGSTDQACADGAAANCSRLQACSNGALLTQRYGDMATCQARLEASCKNSLSAPDTGATPASVEACAAALPAESCTDFLDANPVPACLPQVGTLADNAPCAFNAQCKESYCRIEMGAGCGTCQPAAQIGDPCVPGDGNSCGMNKVCDRLTMTCQAFVVAGGACTVNALCEAGTQCVGMKAAGMGVCTASATTVGATCATKLNTGPGCDADLGLRCDAQTLKCVAVSFAAAGEPCGVINGAEVACAAGGRCKIPAGQAAGLCEAPAADGAACDNAMGPPCLLPARCVATADGGTAGTCLLPSADTCM